MGHGMLTTRPLNTPGNIVAYVTRLRVGERWKVRERDEQMAGWTDRERDRERLPVWNQVLPLTPGLFAKLWKAEEQAGFWVGRCGTEERIIRGTYVSLLPYVPHSWERHCYSVSLGFYKSSSAHFQLNTESIWDKLYRRIKGDGNRLLDSLTGNLSLGRNTSLSQFNSKGLSLSFSHSLSTKGTGADAKERQRREKQRRGQRREKQRRDRGVG